MEAEMVQTRSVQKIPAIPEETKIIAPAGAGGTKLPKPTGDGKVRTSWLMKFKSHKK